MEEKEDIENKVVREECRKTEREKRRMRKIHREIQENQERKSKERWMYKINIERIMEEKVVIRWNKR